MLSKEDHHIKKFIGTTYDVGQPRTIGQLRDVLRELVDDLPHDDDLVISEINGSIDYTLEDGIVQ